ncbi:hypothetical protein LPJ55_000011 [Coemansia sp. RSA 990]|nr:hypothetical protein LPJ55_000011 [Coemansia sp. RSA 990]KAJ2675907.1 hypothetical protein IWW42_000952 [Coemansia sp. RSA 1085]
MANSNVPSLDEILCTDAQDLVSKFDASNAAMEEEPSADEEETVAEGFCVECKDQQAQVFCEQCQEDFCEVCAGMIHRTGRRKQHVLKKLDTPEPAKDVDAAEMSSEDPVADLEDMGAMDVTFSAHSGKVETAEGAFGAWIVERAKYIPLRLTLKERKYLRLLEAALNVSEYTDKIDVLMYGNKTKRMVGQIKELCAILSGLVLASDYKAGQTLFEDRQFADNAEFYQKIFEIGRRHKIMNPDRMRSEYGKLMYVLQDAQLREVQDLLEFNTCSPIKTVYAVLESVHALHILEDEMVAVATREIVNRGKTRSQVQLEIKQKERAIEYLSKAYATPECPGELIRQCLYSIGDNHAFLRFNRDPCDRMLEYLQANFRPQSAESNSLSLAILHGRDGARLSHSHTNQFHYVQQTLTLWREILHDMFMLWYNADSDMLKSRNTYRLQDTGQGLQRVQPCPQVSRAAHAILHRTQKVVGRWVGSSMIHLGDRNVPNALVFIDKYNQVSSILNPVVRVLEFLDSLESSDANANSAASFVKTAFGTIDQARKLILADFFRSAFDGSGADNFFDAGSCIDGRLTSAWNWCSSIEKKPFFNIFLLSGFVGFNGGPEGFS